MSKIIFGGIQPNPKEAKVWLHPHNGLKTYNQNKQEWTGGGSSNDTPTDEPESLYEFVDLGLPSGILWATTNVGATKPEEFGLYFAWGETEGYTAEDVAAGKKVFSWDDYKFGTKDNLTKYNATDGLTVLALEDDAAYQSDKGCRMPSQEELQELIDNTNGTLETLNGVNGRRFTSKTNSNSIFVPAAGYYSNGSVYYVGSDGDLWSSSLDESSSRYALGVYFFSDNVIVDSISRYYGLSIRPVQDPK